MDTVQEASVAETAQHPSPYAQYRELGGKMSETDYWLTIRRFRRKAIPTEFAKVQVHAIGRTVGILPLSKIVIILYGILREEGPRNNDSLAWGVLEPLAEALAMAGDRQSLTKLRVRHPHIFA